MVTLHIYPVAQNHSISHGFRDISFLCFAIFAKNSKIQNGRHFGQDKKVLKIGMATLQRYPVGQKICRNRSIKHGFRDISISVFSLFGKFIINH